MQPDDRTGSKSEITTSHPFSSKMGMRTPKFLIGQARSHASGSRVAVGEDEDEALNGKGWLR
ncbi:MAG: hypothetical protein ACLP4W_25160 [Mycobacterium sp.]|uniref:hypothetical protein n=1 Tax=Mycobacterium sp. TaxID=1785 RepID=UPI003F9A7EF8